jgi:hypothetical protein
MTQRELDAAAGEYAMKRFIAKGDHILCEADLSKDRQVLVHITEPMMEVMGGHARTEESHFRGDGGSHE